MTLTIDKPHRTLSFLRRVIDGFAGWQERRRKRRRRAKALAALEREPDWQLEDIGVRRGNNPQEPQMRRGWW